MLGQFVVNDGNQTVAIIRRNDGYGTSLGAQAAETIGNSGGEVVYDTAYDPEKRTSTATPTRSRPPIPTRSSSSASTSRR